jgi:hypothetical protein
LLQRAFDNQETKFILAPKFNFITMKLRLRVNLLWLIAAICLPALLHAQSTPKTKANWQNLDLKADSVFGISTEKAYSELLNGKKHVPVLVAVIDGGVDVNHEDLKQVIWNNPGEIAGNNTDDDKNGYVDDIHGWDFIGSANGDVHYDNMELTRLVRIDREKFAKLDTDNLQGTDQKLFDDYRKMRKDLADQLKKAQRTYLIITNFNNALIAMLTAINVTNPGINDFKNYTPQNNLESFVKKVLVEHLGDYPDLALYGQQ